MPKRRDEDAPYWTQLREAERRIIEYALEHGQTIRGTASILGISPNYLSERVRELGITPPEVRPGPKPGTKPTPRAPKPPTLRVIPNGETPPPGDDAPDDAAPDEAAETLAQGEEELDEDQDDELDEDDDDEEDDDEEDIPDADDGADQEEDARESTN